MRAWVLAVAASGCSSILGIDDFKLSDGGGPPTDDNPMFDAPPDVASNCFGSGAFVVCLDPLPTMPLAINSAAGGQINTDTDPRCLAAQPMGWTQAGQPSSCFLVATRIEVTAPIVVVGSRPIVLVATDAVEVSASLSVAGRRSTVRAPGAPSAACMQSQPGQDGTTFQAGAGGGGGSFRTIGGPGGDSASQAGGNPGAVQPAPTVLRAGCIGGDGGRGQSGARGAGGPAGGAIYIAAGNRIAIDAPINASGAGGSPGDGATAGGAGGGSGGMIALHAPAIVGGANARLVANGGGAAGGNSGTTTSAPGQDPDPQNPTVPALGGIANNNGRGGNGFAGPNPARPGELGNTSTGGGGGGGGGGYIRANVTTAIQASPSVTVVP